MVTGARQDRFLGTLMGMGIGDAMGMPVKGLSAAEIARVHGEVDRYLPRPLPDGAEIKAGEFTEESELALCIVESATANGGQIDVDNIGVRFLHLARGEAKRWIAPDTLTALEQAEESLEFRVPLDEDGPATGDVAARGIAVGLLHAVGTLDQAALRADAEAVTRITHGSPAAIAATTAVAFAVQLAARGGEPATWAAETTAFLGGGSTADALAEVAVASDGHTRALVERIGTGDGAAEVVATGLALAASGRDLPGVVRAAVSAGGASDSRGAIAGALAGARWGIAGVPQALIDGLEGRIYISLAAPWFYKAALRRAGLFIDLKSQR